MAVEETRRIVPRGDLQGSLGSGEKRWEKAYVGNIGNVYDTVADMVADLELMVGSTVITKGLHVINDGGSGLYHIREKDVSDVADGGSIIFLTNGKVAELITDANESVNVKQFGAKGDGVTDDTNAFRNALIAANGKTFVVPQGNYVINATLFADGVKEIVDNGSYVNAKPVFPAKKPLIKSIDNVEPIMQNDCPQDVTNTQSICFDSKRNHIIVGLKNGVDSAQSGAVQKIVVYDADTLAEVAVYPFTELGHIGSLSYNEEADEIYVSAVYADTPGTYVLSPVDFSVIRFIDNTTMPILAGLAYDNVCKMFVAFDFAWDFGTEAWKYVCYDRNTYEKIKEVIVHTGKNHNTGNMFDIRGGHIVQCSFYGIEEYDLYGNILSSIKLNLESEVEQPCILPDGTVYIVTNTVSKFEVYKVYNTPVTNNIGLKNNKTFNPLVKDANLLLENGAYLFDNDATLNVPHHYGFLVVRSYIANEMSLYGFVSQTFYRNSSSEPTEVYVRDYYNETWTDWKIISTLPAKVSGKSHDYLVTGLTGFITSGATEIHVLLHLGNDISSISQLTSNIAEIRQNGNYIYSRSGGVGSISRIFRNQMDRITGYAEIVIVGTFPNAQNNGVVALAGAITVATT